MQCGECDSGDTVQALWSLVRGRATYLAEWGRLTRGGASELVFKDEIQRREKKGGKSASRKAPSRGRPFTEDSENCQELLTAGAREGRGKTEMGLKRDRLPFYITPLEQIPRNKMILVCLPGEKGSMEHCNRGWMAFRKCWEDVWVGMCVCVGGVCVCVCMFVLEADKRWVRGLLLDNQVHTMSFV